MSLDADSVADGHIDDEQRSRRDLFTKAAVLTAVTTVAGLAISKEAAAGNGNNQPMNQGANNINATISTVLSGGSTFQVLDGGTTGSVGVNARVASIHGYQEGSSRVGVLGEAIGTGFGWGVYGRNHSSQGIGVYGLNTGTAGVGVYGEHQAASTEAGIGVIGVSNTGVGVEARGETFDLVAGRSGRVLVGAAGVPNPPTTGAVGTIARDAVGNLWVCVAANSWRKLAGPATAGSFHAISPSRVYDSRSPAPSPGQLAGGANRLVSVADKRNLGTGAVDTANVVPAGATAIAVNVTVANTAGGGFLAVNAGSDTVVAGSAINWTASGQAIANGIIVPVNASREVTVIAGGGSTDFILDVSGYFL